MIKRLILCPQCNNTLGHITTTNVSDCKHNETHIELKDIKCSICGEVFGIKESNIFNKETDAPDS